jgi:hypothetical protein
MSRLEGREASPLPGHPFEVHPSTVQTRRPGGGAGGGPRPTGLCSTHDSWHCTVMQRGKHDVSSSAPCSSVIVCPSADVSTASAADPAGGGVRLQQPTSSCSQTLLLAHTHTHCHTHIRTHARCHTQTARFHTQTYVPTSSHFAQQHQVS